MAWIQKRTLKDGTARYKAIIRLKGSPVKTKTFGTKLQAQRWAKRAEARIIDGRQLPTREEERRTVDDLIDRYRQDVLPRFSSRDQRKRSRHLDWWSAHLGDQRIHHFRRSMVNEALIALEQGDTPSGRPAAPATRNRYLATLRHAFSYALKELEWISEHPLSRMGTTEPRGRVRYLSDAERERLLTACRESPDPRLYPLVLLAVSTAARQGELLRLRWADVNLGRGFAVLHETKNRERRALPLAGHAAEVLRDHGKLRRLDTDLVFANSTGAAPFPRKPWEDALRAAEIEDFRFHDLRHTAASYLAMSGATLAEIAEILGHKTLAMVKRYSHLTEQHTSAVVARMNEKFLSGG